MTPTRLIALRRPLRSPLTPGSRARRFCMKKTRDQVRRDRRADHLQRGCRARPSGPRRASGCSPSRIALRATKGAGYCPFVFILIAPSAVAKAKVHLVLAQAERPLLLDGGPPSTRRSFRDIRPAGQPSSTSRSAGTASKARPISTAFDAVDRLARADDLDRVQADQPGQSLRAAPAGDEAELDLGQADLRVRGVRTRSGRPSTGSARSRPPCSCRRPGRRSGTAASRPAR